MNEELILEWIKETCDAYCIPKPFAIVEALQAARTSPTADDAKPVEEAVAWLWNEKPSEFNDYQSRPRVTFVRPKNTEAPGGMQALGVIAAAVQPAKDSGDALQELKNFVVAKRFDREIFEDDTAFADWVLSRARAAIASAEREGK